MCSGAGSSKDRPWLTITSVKGLHQPFDRRAHTIAPPSLPHPLGGPTHRSACKMAALSRLPSDKRSCLTRAKLREGRRGASNVGGTPPLGVGGGRAMDARSRDVACREKGGEGRGGVEMGGGTDKHSYTVKDHLHRARSSTITGLSGLQHVLVGEGRWAWQCRVLWDHSLTVPGRLMSRD